MNVELQTVRGGFPPDAPPANQEPRRIKTVLAQSAEAPGEEWLETLPVAHCRFTQPLMTVPFSILNPMSPLPMISP